MNVLEPFSPAILLLSSHATISFTSCNRSTMPSSRSVSTVFEARDQVLIGTDTQIIGTLYTLGILILLPPDMG